ncbi:hypothetical protein FGE12_04310 [Aggregicoccus sp. 17bor-14]|uniref:hypothetical protein n=1 Tax=Myxococcaceae TaxID=31 RepID=UPI00129C66F7|nr:MULTISPECIES: hypothetical protein [Myxococcaceae]MBF5041599.1 hypothetical protein [Simulacricoccus sp. 17bor-14]MRI87384.1 hypothetical protein [Aggregicoccus sp. 17bor-14]
MRSAPALLLLATLVLGSGAPAHADGDPCGPLDGELQQLTVRARTGERGLWLQVQQVQARYPARCDDGALAEGYSELVTSTLAQRWSQVAELARLARTDRAFLAFVLRHVDASASEDDLRRVAENARTACPKGVSRALCADLERAAARALSPK